MEAARAVPFGHLETQPARTQFRGCAQASRSSRGRSAADRFHLNGGALAGQRFDADPTCTLCEIVQAPAIADAALRT